VAFNVEWVAPDPSDLINATKLWARSPTPDYQQIGDGWGWIRPWLGANLTNWVFIAILGALVGTAVLITISRELWRPRVLALLVIPQFLFLMTWFFIGAPHVRYVWAPLLLLGMLPFAWAWQGVGRTKSNGESRVLSRLGKLGTAAISVELILVVILSALIVWPRLGEDMPQVSVIEVPLNQTIGLLLPQETDQCWERFPMCSGMPAIGLKARGSEIAAGFSHEPAG
jgi:hypothetical protein